MGLPLDNLGKFEHQGIIIIDYSIHEKKNPSVHSDLKRMNFKNWKQRGNLSFTENYNLIM